MTDMILHLVMACVFAGLTGFMIRETVEEDPGYRTAPVTLLGLCIFSMVANFVLFAMALAQTQ